MAAKAACGASSTRFHVTRCHSSGLQAAQREQLHPPHGAQQEDECGFEVSILNSLPWNRGEAQRQEGRLASCSPAPDAGSDVDDGEDASAVAEDATGTLTAAQADAGCGLTARVAKSLSQLRLSASGSSANLRSLDCNCCSASAASSGCRPPPAEAQDGDEPQHLGVPWSQNSSSWSRRTCSQRSQCSRGATCPSAASWHQLAAEHRSERFAARRKTFAHSLLQHDCQTEDAYQHYLLQLQDRVQLWLSQTQSPDPGGWEDAEMEGGAEGRTSEGATFFLGSQGP